MPNAFAQAHCAHQDLETALGSAIKAIHDSISGSIDLAVVFAAGYSAQDFDEAAIEVQGKLNASTVIGCTCDTVIGGAQEFEDETAVSIWVANFESSETVPVHLEFTRGTGEDAIAGWPDQLTGEWPKDSLFLALGEPFGFPVEILLERLNEDRPEVVVAGGMASGAQVPGEARLLLNDETFAEGLVAVRLSGIPVRTLVSQGCRPIGKSMVITKAERNIIEALGGKPAFDVLQKLFNTLPVREKLMIQQGLHIGRVINEYQEKFEYGDFLIRNVVGIDEENQAISVGDYVRIGQTVQFHIRDHESASAELEQMLSKEVEKGPFGGALLFTCNGRGLNLFPDPHHDAAMVQSKMPCALAGFFAAGEIGPVGDKNFLHGFTASLVLFE